jgi:hypothetical protein
VFITALHQSPSGARAIQTIPPSPYQITPRSMLTLFTNLLYPTILLGTLLTNTLSLYSSLNIRHQVTHPYKTTEKIIVLHSLFFYDFRQQTRRWKVLEWMLVRITRIRYHLKFLLNEIFICYSRLQIFQHIFKRSVCYFHIMILTCILVITQPHIPRFLCVHF